tara:strand:+ start:9242 stop:11515 length:2274 start_codon:yes stop_codon:yes gene_type:complete
LTEDTALSYKRLIALYIGISASIFADNLHILGTFDFNDNGKGEILKINGLGAPLEFIELNGSDEHKTLWTYTPEAGGEIVDAKFVDLNKDKILELVVIQRNSDLDTWIQIFEWNGVDFTLNEEAISEKEKTSEKVRPSNISIFNNLFSTAISSPTRSANVFRLEYNDDGVVQKSNIKLYSDPIVTNGYGPVYTGIFNSEGVTRIALISPESNVLKVSVFSMSEDEGIISSDVFSLNGARVLLGPDIQAFDENKDGFFELLIPFATGEVYSLSINSGVLLFNKSRLTESNLFTLKSAAGEQEINDVVSQKIKADLFNSGNITMSYDDPIYVEPTDSVMLGDTLDLFIAPDSTSDFFKFEWSSQPPLGMEFDPISQKIYWAPNRDHIGIVDLSYIITSRTNEEIISEISQYGNSHFLKPVLLETMGTRIVFVGDTIIPPEPFVILPKRLHKVTIATKDIDNADRFTFEGETPFSSTTFNSNDIITVGVDTDLSTIKNDKSSSFTFQSSEEKPDSLVTVSIMHDLSSNIIYTSMKPSADTLTQSFDAEGVNPEMYQLPEYFFEGFPSTMSLETTSDSSLTLLQTKREKSGVLTIQSPLFSKSHDIVIEYFGGRPHAIRGDVNVKKDGSHKTLTEIDFESAFSPILIKSLLSSVNRDTLVFHADSIPDTLKAKTQYKSFYSPVKVIEKAMDKSLENPEPDAPAAVEDVEEVPADSTEATEAADIPTETDNSESEQLIENPEPDAPAAVEDVEEVPADSTES